MRENIRVDTNKITFAHPIGVQSNGDFIPKEVLLKAYKNRIGTEIENTTSCDCYSSYIICGVSATDDFIFVECVKNRMK